MKKIITVLILCFSFPFNIFAKNKIVNLNPYKSEKINLDKKIIETENISILGIEDLRINSVGKLYIEQIGDKEEESLKIKANEEIIGLVKAEKKGKFLNLSLVKDNINGNVILEYYVKIKNLKKIRASGVVSIISKNTIKQKKLELKISGSSNANLDLDVNNFYLNSYGSANVDLNLNSKYFNLVQHGAAEINIEGKTKKQIINISGSSEYNAFSFKSEEADIKAYGTSSLYINVDKILIADLFGLSKLSYKGNPSRIEKNKKPLTKFNHFSS